MLQDILPCFVLLYGHLPIISSALLSVKKELGLKKSIFNIKAICFIVLGVFTATAFIMLFYNLAIVRYLIVAVLCICVYHKKESAHSSDQTDEKCSEQRERRRIKTSGNTIKDISNLVEF